MTDAFARSSSRRRRAARRLAPVLAPALGLVLAASAAGCVDERPGVTGTTSLAVELVSPDPGSADERLDDDARAVVVRVSALDEQGEVDESFSRPVDIHVHYLGGLTPPLEDDPLATVDLEAGRSEEVGVQLPDVFGPTYLWIEDADGDDATFATGTSPLLWYRDPFLQDVSRPRDEMAFDALERSPLEAKQVRVSGSRFGANGRLVVTGVYAQGYTLSDVECGEGGAPPCTTGDYDSVLVFSFNRPLGQGSGPIEVGDVIGEVSGGISEFNGLTELGFPQSVVSDEGRDPARVPEPTVIQPEWLGGSIEMERVETALVAIDGATVCELDDDYDTYAQWKLGAGPDGCADTAGIVNVVTQGQVNDFRPGDHVGEVLPRVVGTLRPVEIGSFHVWIIYPRDEEDLTLP
ncbi:MAG TPA: hypothetical protein VKB80_06430 [Kofleriaceae bacterium]|nr:hypothetical protein [Kofleriaceae bacterium]